MDRRQRESRDIYSAAEVAHKARLKDATARFINSSSSERLLLAVKILDARVRELFDSAPDGGV